MDSTASYYMATVGALVAYDVFRHFLKPDADDHTLKFIGRMGVVLVTMAALLTASLSGDALALLGGLAVSYGLQMVPALTAMCYWPFLTRQGVIAGLLSGLAAVTITDGAVLQGFGMELWGHRPLTIHAAAWGLLANFNVALAVSAFTCDDVARKSEWHRRLAEQTALPPHKRRWVLPVAALTLLWLLVAAGPGAVVGNTLFGDPNEPATWLFGVPSVWVWQLGGWAVGVGLLFLLAYVLELGVATKADAAVEDEGL